jgi:hypothetical protein
VRGRIALRKTGSGLVRIAVISHLSFTDHSVYGHAPECRALSRTIQHALRFFTAKLLKYTSIREAVVRAKLGRYQALQG